MSITMRHSEDDYSFLRSIPNGIIEEFRAEMYQPSFIQKHPEKFIDTAWIDVQELKSFMQARKELPPTRVKHVRRVSDASGDAPISLKRVKREESPTRMQDTSIMHKRVKKERSSSIMPKRVKEERSLSPEVAIKKASTTATATALMFRSVIEDGQEVLELVSSDDEQDIEFPVKININDGISSDTLVGDQDFGFDDEVEIDQDMDDFHSDDDPTALEEVTLPSVWLDKEVSSMVKYGYVQITRECAVDCIEYVSGLPSYWPVPRDSRAYIVDLSDPKYDLKDKDGNRMTVDALIKDSDQDSWTGCTGGGINDSCPLVSVFGEEPIRCRRSRLQCAGYAACEHVNPALTNQERYELHADSLDEVLKIQLDARVQEANTPQKLALIFFAVCHSAPCTAKDERGQRCTGVPTLNTFKNNESSNGHRYYVSCSQLSSRFRKDHRTAYIPSGIHDEDLVTLFEGKPLPGFETPFPCGRIVPAHIGSKSSHCKFPHLGNGVQVKLVRHKCSASRTIFIPQDPNIRMACVVPNHEKPHQHPILPASKTSKMIREVYKKCIEAAGIVGSSVRTVDNARTTQMLLGKAPSEYAPALQNNRVKQDIIRTVKKECYPYGTDFPGVVHVMTEDLKLPPEERYIHAFVLSPTDGKVLLTGVPYLLKRIHLAETLFVDTTFKRALGKTNEWEAVIWDPEVQRALTVCRIYSDRADRTQYKTIFDELRRITAKVTGKELQLKRLSKDGTLVSLGVDMELAQALGAADSFLPTNDREYSRIEVETSEELIPYFVRTCYTHAKRGIQDLEGCVTREEFKRLVNFMYLETKEEVDEFSEWVRTLDSPKIQAWWNHKVNNKWILPSLVKCLSKIDPEDWDRTPPTTNIGEGQHHWTNINTGVSLSLLEAVMTARECDEKVAAEVKAALATGILKNHRNDAFTRMSRNTARTTQAHLKAQETREKKSGKAESNSSGRVKLKKFKPAMTKSATAAKVARKQGNKAPSESHSQNLPATSETAPPPPFEFQVDGPPPTVENRLGIDVPPPTLDVDTERGAPLSDVTAAMNMYPQEVSNTSTVAASPVHGNAGLDLFALADLAFKAQDGADLPLYPPMATGFGEWAEQTDPDSIFDSFLAQFGGLDDMYAP